MGTYIIRPTHLTSGGSPLYNNGHTPSQNNFAVWFTYDSANSSSSPTPIIDIISAPNDPSFKFLGILEGSDGPLNSLQDTLRFDFLGNSIYLDGSSSPISLNGLPAGWTPLSAALSVIQDSNYNPPFNAANTCFLQLDTFTESAAFTLTSATTTPSFSYPVLPSALHLINNGCGLRVNVSGTVTGWVNFYQLWMSGTYGIGSSTWYYNPKTNHYTYQATPPTSPLIQQTPVMSVSSIYPNQGPSVGGTPVTILGTGFGDGTTVKLNGVSATNVVVLNQSTITATSGAFGGALVGPQVITINGEDPAHSGFNAYASISNGSVVVTNPDGAIATF